MSNEKKTSENPKGHASLARVRHRISGLSAEAKNKLFAIWMSKERLEGSKPLDIMLALDNEWERIYQKYRIKEGYSAAALKANGRILTIVYGG